jgi:hypothetical protein
MWRSTRTKPAWRWSANDYAQLGIRTMPGSVRQILSGKAKLGRYDFVYAAGLFDYLSAPVAAALTCRMFGCGALRICRDRR